MNKNYLKLFLTAILALPLLIIGVNQFFDISSFWMFVLIVGSIVSTVILGAYTFDPEGSGITAETKPLPILSTLRSLTIIFTIFFLIPWKGMKVMYNTSVSYTAQYEQKTEEKPLFYDAMWEVYSTKASIIGMNKATFLEVATIIMDARKDGPALSWKWVQENTSIPFTSFSDFYGDLSRYIEAKRFEYLALEVQCQRLAYDHNAYLKQFPNNLYNTFIGRKNIHYQYGYLSDSTVRVFTTRRK